jgi:hypothetical protein
MVFSQFTVSLIPHPQTPPNGIDGIDVRWFENGKGLLVLRWLVKGVDTLRVPTFAGKGRGDDLWQNTCGELFLKDRGGNSYRELNFSPSERWAAYRFDGYRDGMAQAEIPIPEVSSNVGQHLFVLTAILDVAILGDAGSAGLSAVIEEKDGTKSYWALAHPPGEPDFHDPACFTLPLPPRQAA